MASEVEVFLRQCKGSSHETVADQIAFTRPFFLDVQAKRQDSIAKTPSVTASYGPLERQKLDYYVPTTEGSSTQKYPVFVFIHGEKVCLPLNLY